jgi:hypothetical protein
MKKSNKLFLLGIAAIFCFLMAHSPEISAQSDRQLNFLPIVPYSRTVNPAITPDYNFYLGIPGLSNVAAGIETTFHFDDIFQTNGDSLILDREYFMSNLDDENQINFNLQVEYLTFGFKAGKNFFHFRIAERIQNEFMLKKDLLEFVLYGNGNENFLGKPINIGASSLNTMVYREYSLGYSRSVSEKLNVGANFKYLQGLANLTTEKSDFELTTNADDFALTVRSDILINMSVPGIDDEDIDPAIFLPPGANNGFAFDVGAEYKINSQFEAHASLLDLGGIKWNENLKNYRTANPQKTFTYEGFDIGEYFQDGQFDNDRVENIFDSIADEIGIEETAEAYSSKLTPVLNIGGRFNFTKNDVFSLLLNNRFQTGNSWTALSIAYTRKFGRDFNIMLSNTSFTKSYFNPNAGIAANLGPLQIFAVTENILAPFNISTTKIFNFRFGLILVFEPKGEKIIIDETKETQNGQ